MRHNLRASIAIATLAVVLGVNPSAVRAQSDEPRPQGVEELKSQIAALQRKVQRLEFEQQRTALQDRVRTLEAKRDQAKREQPALSARDQPPLSAYAADIPVKAPVAVPYLNWSGFYAGINAGYGIGRDKTTLRLCGNANPADCRNEQFKVSPIGVIGGVQAGYNWHWSRNWVFGVAADIQSSGQKGTVCTFNCLVTGPNAPVVTTIDRNLNWFATLRGRVGYAQNGWLAYVTAGGAVGEVQTSVSSTLLASTSSANSNDLKFGYAVGAGLETQFRGGWSGKIEYLYMDLGTVTSQVTLADRSGAVTSDIRDHIIRVGLNHRFGGSDAAYAAAPGISPIADWSGVYLGINVGYGVGRNPSVQSETLTPGFGVLMADELAFSPAGVIGGAQAGYNWQRGPVVMGVEADMQGTGQKDRTCLLGCSTLSPVQNIVTTQSLDWFATLRGRVGLAANGWLWYVTGGGAAAHIKTNVTASLPQNSVPAVANANFGDLKFGWVAGLGVEAQLADNWSWKLEYLYLDLGHVNSSVTTVGLIGPATIATSSDIHNHVFRAGVNYRFSSPGSVVARY
jgi:outer membrane immunogenic protein